MRHAITALAFVLGFILTSANSLAVEPGGTIGTAEPTGISGTGCYEPGDGVVIETPQDVDLFEVVADAGTHLVAITETNGIGAAPTRHIRVFSFDGSVATEIAANVLLDGRPQQAGVSIPITTAGTYYVGVSGFGNGSYNPVDGSGGADGLTGYYAFRIGVQSDTGAAPEFNDAIDWATIPTNTGGPGAFTATIAGTTDDGPWAGCTGDADYYLVNAADLTPGHMLRAGVDINDAYVAIYATDGDAAGTPATFANLVAIRAIANSQAAVVIEPSMNYAILVQSQPAFGDCILAKGLASSDYVPFDPTRPGSGDFGSDFGATNPHAYNLQIEEIPDPGAPGPYEPNDSLAQAAANAVISVGTSFTTVNAFQGDGRWGMAIDPNVHDGDTDIYILDGVSPGDAVEAYTVPNLPNGFLPTYGVEGTTLVSLPIPDFVFAPSSTRNIFRYSGAGTPALLVAPAESRSSCGLLSGLPWDLNEPGTQLQGDPADAADYTIRIRALPPPPPVPAAGRLWAVYRGALNTSILEISPSTGDVVNGFPAPALVNGASTGLAYAHLPPGHTTDVLYYLNSQGTITRQLRLWELDPEDGSFVPGAPAGGFRRLDNDSWFAGNAGISYDDLVGGTDGLGYAGGKLWMCNQNTDKIIRFDTVTRTGTHVIPFTDPPFNHQCRDGLEGTDRSTLGSGSVIYVAAREDRVIVIMDVGTSGNGPNNDQVFVNLGEFDDPTYEGGAGIANTGGIGLLGSLVYIGSINGYTTLAVDQDAAPGANLSGFIAQDFGLSGLASYAGLLGDFDGDGDVDAADFVTFTQCFGGSLNPPAATCPAGVDADLDLDGDVDAQDFVLFGQQFTGSL